MKTFVCVIIVLTSTFPEYFTELFSLVLALTVFGFLDIIF